MQTISVRTTQNVFIHYPLASVGDRILAYLIDWAILAIYLFAVIGSMIKLEIEVWWLFVILAGVPFVFYHLFFEIFMNGQSPGKRLMKIKVVRIDGAQASIGDYLLRWMFGFVELYLFSGAIALVAVAAGGKGQRLGDMVAGTAVVKLIAQREITANEIFITPDETYAPTFPQVVQLGSKEIELIQRALEANRNHGNQQPVLLVTDKIQKLLGIRTDLPPAQFLYTIVKDFNHLTSR